MDDRHTITAGGLSATILAHGAELCSLRGIDGAEHLWQALPAWPRHAPILFPIVGRLADDTLRVGERRFRMGQHGFARDRMFSWADRSPTACTLTLTDDAATREKYPFSFRLTAGYAISADALTLDLVVENTGAETLPASLGLHPAFAWPLRAGLDKTAHRVAFEQPEPAPVRRLSGGLLLPEPFPSPIDGAVLSLHEELFAADAVILDQPASRAVRYFVPGGPAIGLAWYGFPQLGLWSKPADFLCIEPWHGHADPVGFSGDITDKPGMAHLAPGERLRAGLTVSIRNHSDDD